MKRSKIERERERRETMDKKHAWKVEPDLVDRFLEVLSDNGFEWRTGHKANEFCPLQDDVPLLFIEGTRKRIYYTRYFSYPDNLEEEYNVTDVTEELLEDMERGMALDKLRRGK